MEYLKIRFALFKQIWFPAYIFTLIELRANNLKVKFERCILRNTTYDLIIGGSVVEFNRNNFVYI